MLQSVLDWFAVPGVHWNIWPEYIFPSPGRKQLLTLSNSTNRDDQVHLESRFPVWTKIPALVHRSAIPPLLSVLSTSVQESHLVQKHNHICPQEKDPGVSTASFKLNPNGFLFSKFTAVGSICSFTFNVILFNSHLLSFSRCLFIFACLKRLNTEVVIHFKRRWRYREAKYYL